MADTHPPPSRWRRLRRVLSALALLVVLLEVVTRIVLTLPPWLRPFLAAPRHIFHGEIATVETAAPKPADGVDVLLLGASVVDPRWSQVGVRLALRLEQELGGGAPGATPRVRVFNIARAGQNSLDSLYKYRRLAGHDFDAVVVYHGINDVRANACPEEVFRDDYSQYVWYRVLAAREPSPDEPLARPGDSPLVLPTALRYAGLAVAEQAGWVTTLPPETPREEWLDEGAEIKTGRTFRRNIQGLITLANDGDVPILLAGFTTWMDGQALEAAAEAPFPLNLDLWGRPQNVLAGIAAHNAVLRDLAGQPGVVMVEMDALATHRNEVFTDICHLTPLGSEAFVERLLPPLVAMLRARD
ncbi:MAG: hypothetical protein ACYTG2_11820 [Planctomycetota bacterium]|jgi:hypothetical protein